MRSVRIMAFDRYRIDPARRRLLRDGAPVEINGKTFDLLLEFAGSGGALLTRERLYERLWPGGFVEDGNLTQNVYLLRRALDPSGDGRAFIQTLPRYGYRFLKPVREIGRPGLVHRAVASAAAVILAAALAIAASPALKPRPALPAGVQTLYALGEFHLTMRSRTDLLYAADYFKQIVRRAPQSAVGYAGVASAEALLAEFETDGSLAQRRDVALAIRARDTALLHDRNNTDALAVSGFIAYRFFNDEAAATRYLERALASNPNNASAHHWHGVLLLANGRIAEATAEFRAAHALQPTSEVYSRWLARAYVYARRPNEAIVLALQTIRLNRDDAPAWLAIAAAQEQRGELQEAMRTLHQLGRLIPYEQRYALPDEARLKALLDRKQRPAIAERVDKLVAVDQADPFEAALFYRTIGRTADARKILRAARSNRFETAIEKYDPRSQG